ncbi:membrane protein [Microbacterium phage Cece]|nr:membrane protein [Microbacterium phage Cece]UVG35346.1 membrane protein [Microbacterium phage Cece]
MHSATYLRRRTLIRWVFWTPITLLGFGLIFGSLATWPV